MRYLSSWRWSAPVSAATEAAPAEAAAKAAAAKAATTERAVAERAFAEGARMAHGEGRGRRNVKMLGSKTMLRNITTACHVVMRVEAGRWIVRMNEVVRGYDIGQRALSLACDHAAIVRIVVVA